MAAADRPRLDPDVSVYYAEGREGVRLETVSRLERLRTLDVLDRHLPPPPARILDVGGGTGAYAGPLADRGYDVVLVDPVPLHVEQARAASGGRFAVEEGDARALTAADGSVDVVLELGPLYHLVDRDDRLRALQEARRAARGGGRLVVAAVCRFASTWDGLVHGHLDDPAFERIVEGDLATGVHRNPERRRGWFTTAYFHRPEELAEEVVEAGWSLEAVVAVEGLAGFLPGLDDVLDDGPRAATLLRALRRVESEPALLGASAHLLAIATAPSP